MICNERNGEHTIVIRLNNLNISYSVMPVLLFMAVLLGLGGCSRTSSEPVPYGPGGGCTFTNPVAYGQDPWVTRNDSSYYYIESRDGGLYISKSEVLTDLKDQQQRVWSTPEEGWNRSSLWAPELHFIDGKWYIYYAAGRSGPPFIHQRSGVLQSVTDDPMGPYVEYGPLYTGDEISTRTNNLWSIDLTVLTHEGQRYAIWSGWKENRDTDHTPQHLYIARMENPWTIGSNRVKISSPTEPWERGSELAINEGPQVLKHNGITFVVYSASESWLPAYKLGMLRLTGDDPMNPESWTKQGPVFQGTDEVHGTGHASFTISPDGSENWIIYHTKVNPEPGWNRVVHMQPFSWKANGAPDFGAPVPAGTEIPKPSGQCFR